jgi:hypothetical protein
MRKTGKVALNGPVLSPIFSKNKVRSFFFLCFDQQKSIWRQKKEGRQADRLTGDLLTGRQTLEQAQRQTDWQTVVNLNDEQLTYPF